MMESADHGFKRAIKNLLPTWKEKEHNEKRRIYIYLKSNGASRKENHSTWIEKFMVSRFHTAEYSIRDLREQY